MRYRLRTLLIEFPLMKERTMKAKATSTAACWLTLVSTIVSAQTPKPNLPVPQLVCTGKAEEAIRGVEITRYKFAIKNYNVFREYLFKPSPDLPPFGKNTSASRTTVTVYDATGKQLKGFVGFGTNEDLDQIYFAVKKGEAPPDQVYVEFHDRKLDTKVKSNLVSLEEMARNRKR